MEFGANIDAVLRKYLLGDALAQEQDSVDKWLLSDEQAYDLLAAAEDDLIDDALAGRLGERDLRLFNDNFLAAPERQRKYQFGRSFRRAVNTAPQKQAAAPRFTLWDVFRLRPGFAYAACALIAILMVGGTWSLFRLAELQQELHSATDQLAGLRSDRDDLQRQLEQSQAEARALQQQAQLSETAGRGQSAAAPVLLALNLMPGLTRSSSDIPKLALAANASGVRFSLVLLDDNFPAYRVTLRAADDREIWSQNKVSATATRDGKAIVLTVPATVLASGDYSFNLLGLPDTGSPESVARYSFRATR